MEYISQTYQLIRPVHTSVAKCKTMDLFLKLHSQLPFADPPLPVLSYCGRLVHSATVIQAHIILHRDHTELCTASHNQADKAFMQLFIRCIVITEIIPGKLTLFCHNALPPSGDSLIIMGSCVYHTVLRIVVWKIIVGTT